MNRHPIDAYGRSVEIHETAIIMPTGEGTMHQYGVRINGQDCTVAGASAVVRELLRCIWIAELRNNEISASRHQEAFAK